MVTTRSSLAARDASIEVRDADVEMGTASTVTPHPQTKWEDSDITSFDRNGDLILLAGGGNPGPESGAEAAGAEPPAKFRVCSATLRRSSPVFDKMLYGGWKESKPQSVYNLDASQRHQEWVVALPDDDPAALEVALTIIHGMFDKVPTREAMPIELLYHLLALTNKYDMTQIVRPWVNQWLDLARKLPAADKGQPDFIIASTFIAWEVGDEQLFARRCVTLCVQASINAEDNLVFFGEVDSTAVDYLGPMDMIGEFSPTH